MTPESEEHPQPKAKRPAWKTWLFRLLAVAIGPLFLMAVEVGMRAFDLGRNLNLVVSVDSEASNQYQLNPLVDQPYFGKFDLCGPEPRQFTLPKPAETCRIVVIGGSTVIGFPYPPELAFPRILEILLQQQTEDIQFEVLNLGITSINSHSVLDLVKQSASLDPDLVIVHTGHNEFYGPGGGGSTAQFLPWLTAFRRLRTVDWVAQSLIGTGSTNKQLPEELAGEMVIPLESELFRRVKQQYQANLSNMVDILNDRGVDVVLTTVSGNLRSQGPIRPYPSSEFSPARSAELQSLLDQYKAHMLQGNFQSALAALEQAEEVSGPYGLISYRKAQCYLQLGNQEQALELFVEANNLDGCRFRAPEVFGSVVRNVARDKGVPMLDLRSMIRDKQFATSESLYWEHVHYTFAGHCTIADALSEFVLRHHFGKEPVPRERKAEEIATAALGFMEMDQLAALSSVFEIIRTEPFASAVDADVILTRTTNEMSELFHNLPADQQTVFADLSVDQLTSDLPRTLAQRYKQLGDDQKAAQFAKLATIRRPWNR